MAASSIIEPNAQMAKLVDAPASGAGDRKVVEVRVLFWAPSFQMGLCIFSALPHRIERQRAAPALSLKWVLQEYGFIALRPCRNHCNRFARNGFDPAQKCLCF